MTRKNRQGFALLVVLSTLVAATAVVALIDGEGRDELDRVRNRSVLARERWHAESCVARARASIDEVLHERDGRGTRWRELDALTQESLQKLPCAVLLRPAGITRNVNDLDEHGLHALMRQAGMAEVSADSLMDAILDWRDADDSPRPTGAERAWYVAAGRAVPRNGDLRSVDEIRLVRGADEHPELFTVLSTETDRIWLDRAPLEVVASLPGLDPEAVAGLAALRTAHVSVDGPGALAASLGPAARQDIMTHFVEISALVASQPDAWYLTATSGDTAGAYVRVRVRLVLVGGSAAVGRWQIWS